MEKGGGGEEGAVDRERNQCFVHLGLSAKFSEV